MELLEQQIKLLQGQLASHKVWAIATSPGMWGFPIP
jgi:hypothetical protein